MNEVEQPSPRWRHAVVATFTFGFAVLLLLTVKAYVFTGDNVRSGPR